MKRKLFVIGTDEPSIYSLRSSDDTLKLFYSKVSTNWSRDVSGKLAAKLIDTGNDIQIHTGFPMVIELDYSEALQTHLLLAQWFTDQNEKLSEFEEL